MRGLRSLLVAMTALLWPLSLGAAPVQDLDLVYNIHVGGLSMGTLRVRATVAGADYHLRSDLQTSGLIGWLTGFTSLAVSDGIFTAEGPRPRIHRADNLWRGDKRWSEQQYIPGRPVLGDVFPSLAADERDPVPSDQTTGTLDPLTAGLALSAVAGSGSAEPRVIPVFDGRRRYDLIAKPEAPEAIVAPAYAGPARVVDVSMRRVAGFSPVPFFARSSKDETARIWFAPARGNLLPHHDVPVRMQSDGPLGLVVVTLVALPAPG